MKLAEPIWHNQAKATLLKLPGFVKQELFADNSLTIRISDVGAFSVAVIEQKKSELFLGESLSLKVFPKSLANVRNVLLGCDNTPVIFARTVLPLPYLKRNTLRLTKLGNKSLGSVLHANRTTIKQPTEIAILDTTHYLFNYIQNKCKVKLRSKIYARRTIFEFDQHRLLVNEIYLPAYWQKIYSDV